MRSLRVAVKNINGHCPVYEVGDVFHIIDGYKLKASKPLCMHALGSLMPYYVALSRGMSPAELGLGNDKAAYVQCLDPCEYTDGGTVVFEISKKEHRGKGAKG